MQMKLEIVVVYIQSYMRMFLAKLKRQRLKERKFSVVVQKYLRKYLAKKVYFRMISEAYDLMKLRKIQIIQKHARNFLAKVKLENEKKEKMAILI